MILFWSIAALFSAAALLFLLPPLLRRRVAAADLRSDANAEIYRGELAELQSELDRGVLSREQFESARREIQRRVVVEHTDVASPAPIPRRATGAAIAIAVLLPLVAGVAYWSFGNPQALDESAVLAGAPGHEVTPDEMAGLVEKLA